MEYKVDLSKLPVKVELCGLSGVEEKERQALTVQMLFAIAERLEAAVVELQKIAKRKLVQGMWTYEPKETPDG